MSVKYNDVDNQKTQWLIILCLVIDYVYISLIILFQFDLSELLGDS